MKQLYQTVDGRLFENSFEAERHEEQLKNYPKTDKEIVEHNLAICLSNISRLKSFLLKSAEDRLANCWLLLDQSLPHKKSDLLNVIEKDPGKHGYLTPTSQFIERTNDAIDSARSLKRRMRILKMSKEMSKKYNAMLKKLRINPEEHIPAELLKTPEEV